MISNEVNKIYSSIDLFNRYYLLSNNFNSEDSLEDYDSIEIGEIFYKENCDFRFNKKESFFGLTEEFENYTFKLNFSLKYGVVESIIWGKNDESGDQYGGPISRMVKQIQIAEGVEEIEKVNYPRFSSPSDLRLIIKELYSIYEDFKMEIRNIRLPL